ncbi:UPF0481 protein At3g47200-like [Carya illinoinensis]|uniref:UPF0481 protein At3g47200-like n=1 Tax=Carya illinoinensis TaxID=32201 RepID=UPI001C722D40|nr:UPF0481 protein At3g47200-like [Carya illinoinensis]
MDKDKQIDIYKRCLQRIGQLEEDIRKCYSEEFEVNGIVFLEMMVVDACFIIEIIEIFAFTKEEVDSSESDLGALAWMGQARLSVDSPFIHCISKLRLAGIKVSPVMALSLLEVRFKRGVIDMPNIAIDDFMSVAELCGIRAKPPEKQQVLFGLRYFFGLPGEHQGGREYLRERNVIDNYLANDSEVAQFINSAGKDLVLDDKCFYLGKLFEDVDKHYRNRWMWKWASFKREYFDKPWLLLSAAGGLLLVLATSFQAIMAYKFKNN